MKKVSLTKKEVASAARSVKQMADSTGKRIKLSGNMLTIPFDRETGESKPDEDEPPAPQVKPPFHLDAAVLVALSDMERFRDQSLGKPQMLETYLAEETYIVKRSLQAPTSGSRGRLYLTDAYGLPTLSFSVHGNTISFWTLRSTQSVGTYNEIPKDLRSICEHVSKGELRCNDCGKWMPAKKAKQVSYAGVCCAKCYRKHAGETLDTSG